ncbi:MAG: GNAT family N-acetyltransferase, partial [Pseudomonadota bacterium]
DTRARSRYLLDAAHQGKGYATEAAAAVRDHAIGPMALPSLLSFVYAPNTRSIAVADRLGAYQDPPPDWPHPDTLVFRHHPKAAHD